MRIEKEHDFQEWIFKNSGAYGFIFLCFSDLGRYKNGETGELVHGIFNRRVMIDGNV